MDESNDEDYDDELDEEGGSMKPKGHAEIQGSKVIVRDLATTVKLKKVQARAASDERREEARTRIMEAKLEIAKLKIGMDAREAASKHLATFAGLYMTLMVLSFLVSVKFLDPELIAVVAGLITLVVTSISALLRSIVVEAPTPGLGNTSKDEETNSSDHGSF